MEAGLERRRSERRESDEAVEFLVGGRRYQGLLVDHSHWGAKLKARHSWKVGQRVALAAGGGERRHARIAWTRAAYAGLRFEREPLKVELFTAFGVRPIEVGEVLHLQPGNLVLRCRQPLPVLDCPRLRLLDWGGAPGVEVIGRRVRCQRDSQGWWLQYFVLGRMSQQSLRGYNDLIDLFEGPQTAAIGG